MDHGVAAAGACCLHHQTGLFQRELRLVRHSTGIKVNDSGENQFDLVVAGGQRADRFANALGIVHVLRHEGAIALGALDAQTGRTHVRQAAVGPLRFRADAVVDAMPVTGVTHQCDAASQRLTSAGTRGLGELVQRLFEMLRAHFVIGGGTIQEEVDMGVHQPRHQESAALHRQPASGQGRRMVACGDVGDMVVGHRQGDGSGVPPLTVKPAVHNDRKTRIVFRFHRLRPCKTCALPAAHCCRSAPGSCGRL